MLSEAYQQFDTVLCKVETDTNFLHEIRQIAEKRKANKHDFFDDKKQEIDAYHTNLIHEKAQRHAEANLVNTKTLQLHETGQILNMCECGCKKQKGAQLPFLINQQKISSLGSGALLVFFYLRYIRLLIFLSFLIYGSFSLVSHALFSSEKVIECDILYKQEEFIRKSYCEMGTKISFQNVHTNRFIILLQGIFGCIMCFAWMVSVKIIFTLGLYQDQKIDQTLQSDSDYHVIINNLPYGQSQQTQILDYIEHIWNSNDNIQPLEQLNIKSIQILYNMSESRKIVEQIMDISIQIVKCLQNQCYRFSNLIKQDKILQYKQLKKEYWKRISLLEKMRKSFLADKEYRRKISTTCAILEFQTQEEQKHFLKCLGTEINPIQNILLPNQNPKFKDEELLINRSPEPSDILWASCEKKFNYGKWFLIWVVTFFILYLGYAVVSYIQIMRIFSMVDHVVITIALQLVNRLIWFYLSIVVSYEDNNTRTDTIISSVKKSIIAQTMNIIVGPIIAKFVTGKALYGPNGLAHVALTYQLVMFGMMILYYILNPFYLIKKFFLKIRCTRQIIIRHLCRVVGKIDTYEEIKPVLTFYEGPEFPVAGAYVYITSAVFHAMFYCHLQPLILLIVGVNTSFFFIIMKYMLLRRCKIPDLTRIDIFSYSMFMISLAPLYFIIGRIFFLTIDEQKPDNFFIVHLPSVIALLIWFISILDVGKVFTSLYKSIMQVLIQQDDRRPKVHPSTRSGMPIFHFNTGVFGEEALNKNWKRKQTYYRNSTLNVLLEFQYYLKQVKDSQAKYQGEKLRTFCESFCKKIRIKTSNQKNTNNSRFFFVENQHFDNQSKQEGNVPEVNICFIPVEKIRSDSLGNEVCEVSGFFLKATAQIVQEKEKSSTSTKANGILKTSRKNKNIEKALIEELKQKKPTFIDDID